MQRVKILVHQDAKARHYSYLLSREIFNNAVPTSKVIYRRMI
jgi:hypothetical protein